MSFLPVSIVGNIAVKHFTCEVQNICEMFIRVNTMVGCKNTLLKTNDNFAA